MDTMELMKARHSVRRYDNRPLTAADASALEEEIAAVNKESGFRMQLVTDEPEAFQAEKPSYGSFQGCRNYLALVGPRGMDEEAGYYGERVVLAAQALGVNSCWVALTYKKGKTDVQIGPGEKLYMVISLGYGLTQGHERKSKTAAEVSDLADGDPAWYKNGIEAALLAPTAMNQQKFRFTRSGNRVQAKAGLGFYAKVDLGIVKYHFELGAGKDAFTWA